MASSFGSSSTTAVRELSGEWCSCRSGGSPGEAPSSTTRASSSFEVRRTLQDLPGADTVTASAWGPRGLVCRADATLPDS